MFGCSLVLLVEKQTSFGGILGAQSNGNHINPNIATCMLNISVDQQEKQIIKKSIFSPKKKKIAHMEYCLMAWKMNKSRDFLKDVDLEAE